VMNSTCSNGWARMSPFLGDREEVFGPAEPMRDYTSVDAGPGAGEAAGAGSGYGALLGWWRSDCHLASRRRRKGPAGDMRASPGLLGDGGGWGAYKCV
jgi:hypothetical protein